MNYCSVWISLWLLVGTLCWLSGCAETEEVTQGRQLAGQYCGNCHQLPEPSLLPKSVWAKSVLPRMALRLGLKDGMDTSATLTAAYFALRQAKLAPDKALVTAEEWQAIQAYYDHLAPDQLPGQSASQLPITSLFRVQSPQSAPVVAPAVTHIAYDSLRHEFLVADQAQRSFIRVNQSLTGRSPTASKGLVSQLQWLNSEPSGRTALVTYLGPAIEPSEAKTGSVSSVTFSAESGVATETTLLSGLHRPTQTVACDLTNDGQDELVVCEFGFLTGKLSYWQRGSKGTYQEHLLRSEPGALQVISHDLNQDGWSDLVVLFAQGDERILWFENLKDGQFREHVLLRFPPSYGSSSLNVADVNGDQKPDLVYTCGDNADYSKILKNYHGVYIFENKGHQRFEQSYFFPQNGAYQTQIDDFDRDGDMDIATVSFFADYNQRFDESFIFLENDRNRKFKPFSLNVRDLGRWITLSAGDIDRDGDTDLLLGSCSVADGFIRTFDNQWRKKPPYVLLENTTIP